MRKYQTLLIENKSKESSYLYANLKPLLAYNNSSYKSIDSNFLLAKAFSTHDNSSIQIKKRFCHFSYEPHSVEDCLIYEFGTTAEINDKKYSDQIFSGHLTQNVSNIQVSNYYLISFNNVHKKENVNLISVYFLNNQQRNENKNLFISLKQALVLCEYVDGNTSNHIDKLIIVSSKTLSQSK